MSPVKSLEKDSWPSPRQAAPACPHPTQDSTHGQERCRLLERSTLGLQGLSPPWPSVDHTVALTGPVTQAPELWVQASSFHWLLDCPGGKHSTTEKLLL